MFKLGLTGGALNGQSGGKGRRRGGVGGSKGRGGVWELEETAVMS